MKMENLSIVTTLKRYSVPSNVIWIINPNMSRFDWLIFSLRPFINIQRCSFAFFFRWKLLSELPKMPSQLGPQKVHWKDLGSWTNWQTLLNMTWKNLPKQSQRIRVKMWTVHLKYIVLMSTGTEDVVQIFSCELLVQTVVDVHEFCRSPWSGIPVASEVLLLWLAKCWLELLHICDAILQGSCYWWWLCCAGDYLGAWAQWCLEELFTACNNTALCLVLFQEKLLRLLEQWTSPGPCTTSGSLPHPSSITPQSAPRWQAWAACTTPHGSLWELVRCSWNPKNWAVPASDNWEMTFFPKASTYCFLAAC